MTYSVYLDQRFNSDDWTTMCAFYNWLHERVGEGSYVWSREIYSFKFKLSEDALAFKIYFGI